jgi:Transglutaminase-like superfamily
MRLILRARLIFRCVWWMSNLLLTVALIATICSGVWEFSMRKYLKGFSDAIVPEASAPQQKAEAILAWMRNGPPRLEAQRPGELSVRDPQDTLNYRQLLQVCGSATNAFLNLSRSAGLSTRRLLLLAPDRTANHVVAELNVDGRWVVVDPAYRTFMKDAQGNLLTRKDLQDPRMFQEATGSLAGYSPDYRYDRFAHVRLAALPFQGTQIRSLLDKTLPNWDEYLDWSLLLERRSFMYLFISVTSLILLMLVRVILGWLADHRLKIPRFHLRTNLSRATAAFFSTPEIK